MFKISCDRILFKGFPNYRFNFPTLKLTKPFNNHDYSDGAGSRPATQQRDQVKVPVFGQSTEQSVGSNKERPKPTSTVTVNGSQPQPQNLTASGSSSAVNNSNSTPSNNTVAPSNNNSTTASNTGGKNGL
jgi:hypothetical protein